MYASIEGKKTTISLKYLLIVVQELFFFVLEQIMRNKFSKSFTACECSLNLEKSLLYLYFGKTEGGVLSQWLPVSPGKPVRPGSEGREELQTCKALDRMKGSGK